MDFKDYAPYYIGCRCFNTWFPEGHKQYDKGWKLMGVCPAYARNGKPYLLENEDDYTWTDSIKPILRHLSDMTKEETDELEKIKGTKVVYRSHLPMEIKYDTPETFHWMLKKQFDLFSLIENSLAIDSKTLK